MATTLSDLVSSRQHSATRCESSRRRIYDRLLQRSRHVDAGNFAALDATDVGQLCDQYDQSFFDGQIRHALGTTPLRFRLSKRMSTSGGQTARYRPRHPARQAYFEIAVSSTLLFQSFEDDDHRAITVAGIGCHDRLRALQLIVEHELVHLVEMLLWNTSRCAGPRFQSIAWRFFGHTGHTHALITPRERALRKFGIGPGTPVRFVANGTWLSGVVCRVTKRATVLVKDRRGVRYTDGHAYSKYYVPVKLLEPMTRVSAFLAGLRPVPPPVRALRGTTDLR